MLVHAAPHVLDLDVPQPRRGGADARGGRFGFQALAVADVQGQAKDVGGRRVEGGAQAVKTGEVGEEVARFGFDGEGDAGGGGRVEYGGERVGEASPGDGFRRTGWTRPAEAVHGRGAEVGGDADRGAEQLDAGRTGVRVGGEESGVVLTAGVEDVPGAGFDGGGQAEGVEAARQLDGA